MSNLSTLPKGDSAWLLRKAIERIIQQVSVLETNIGASTSGNSANTQIIFNDNGTLRGDAGLVYNKTTDALTVAGLVTAGSATITGALTVDTSTLKVDSTNHRVGIVQATPLYPLHLVGEFGLEEASSGNGTKLRLIGDATKYNFRLGKQLTATNTFEITPSTAVGGTTFSNPVYTVTYDGIHTFLDGASGTRMTLNSTGLGVGKTPAARLDVASARAASVIGGIVGTTGTGVIADECQFLIKNVNTASGQNNGAGIGGLLEASASNKSSLLFYVDNGTAVTNVGRFDSAGNLGIGVTPSAWSSTFKSIQMGSGTVSASFVSQSNSPVARIVTNAYYDGTNFVKIANNTAGMYALQGSSHEWYNAITGTGTAAFVQAMTLDASGNLLVGTPSALASGSTFQNLGLNRQVLTLKGDTAVSYTSGIWNASTTNDALFQYFATETALNVRGGISYNRAGGLVAYNTTSDYRAKDIIGPVSNSGSLIDSLKVYVGKMKGATIARPMLIAHEAQEVAPYAVTGTKDEVDAEGKPKYQQMDASALVPLLIAEIQSLRARVQTLEAK